MKKLLLVLIVLLPAALNRVDAQINTQDSLALVQLYYSTNGPRWTIQTNWLTKDPLDTWFGITVTGGRVTAINLVGANLSGTIPASISTISLLETLNLSANKFTGSIPTVLTGLGNLKTLDLSANQFSGQIPGELSLISGLQTLNLTSNLLTGPIPAALGNLSQLQFLTLNINKLNQQIPAELGLLRNLQLLDLSFNSLTGNIPASLGGLSKLQNLSFAANQLSGSIPTEFGNMIQLQHLHLGANQLSGQIPAQLGDLKQLNYLHLESNLLSSPIPMTIGALAKLTDIDVSNNSFVFDGGLEGIARINGSVYAPQAAPLLNRQGPFGPFSVSAIATSDLSDNSAQDVHVAWYRNGRLDNSSDFGDTSAYYDTLKTGDVLYAQATSSVATQLILKTGTYKIPSNAPQASVSSFSPQFGIKGTSVQIKGKNLNGVTAVSFGGVQAASFKINSSSSISAVVGNGASGTVSVTTALGIASKPGFTFIPKPAIRANGPTSIKKGGNVTLTASPKGYAYQWQMNGAPLNKGGSILVVAQAGSYTASLTYNGITQVSAPLVITITTSPQPPPVISYPADTVALTAGSSMDSLLPFNSGGGIPAQMYGQITRFAGGDNTGYVDGSDTTARFNFPLTLATDRNGNVYVADKNNNRIRMITPDGQVSTLAGNGQQGAANGPALQASFNAPFGIAVDPQGNVFVADNNNLIRCVTTNLVVSTFAGNGVPKDIDGFGTAAGFNEPMGIAIDNYENLYVCELRGRVRKIIGGGYVTTMPDPPAALPHEPHVFYGIATDGIGTIYVSDIAETVWKIDQTLSWTEFVKGAPEFDQWPYCIAYGTGGNLYVTNQADEVLRFTQNKSRSAFRGFPGNFGGLHGIAIDGNGNIYASDNTKIFKLTTTGYQITPALPAGLIFDPATGIISGTPLSAGSPTTYTITAFNESGGSSYTITIGVTLAHP